MIQGKRSAQFQAYSQCSKEVSYSGSHVYYIFKSQMGRNVGLSQQYPLASFLTSPNWSVICKGG